MKTIKSIMKLLLACSLLLPFAAQAALNDCMSELDAVERAIVTADFSVDSRKGESNRSNLISKLVAAEGKVTLDKFSDAIDKLLGISDKATIWADPEVTRKPKLADASDINTAVSAAIDCVALLGSPAP